MTNKVENKKRNKIVGIVTIFLLLLSLYFVFFYPKLKIEVFNKTAYKIDSLEIDGKFFSIKKGDSLLIDNCKSISMQSNLPFGLPEAKIEGKIKDTFMLLFCGTGVKEIKNGKFKFDIKLSEDSNFYRLYWQVHK